MERLSVVSTGEEAEFAEVAMLVKEHTALINL